MDREKNLRTFFCHHSGGKHQSRQTVYFGGEAMLFVSSHMADVENIGVGQGNTGTKQK